jgi:hypothetical protein
VTFLTFKTAITHLINLCDFRVSHGRDFICLRSGLTWLPAVVEVDVVVVDECVVDELIVDEVTSTVVVLVEAVVEVV